jgi:hypothetical protein
LTMKSSFSQCHSFSSGQSLWAPGLCVCTKLQEASTGDRNSEKKPQSSDCCIQTLPGHRCFSTGQQACHQP